LKEELNVLRDRTREVVSHLGKRCEADNVRVDLWGRLSNPPETLESLAGPGVESSIDELARSLGVNRTTIITHLDQHGVPRRRVVRK
jgi:hypothetical protein